MAFWRKEKQVSSIISEQPKECEHKYQDFPWYISASISDDKYSIDIIEPYVCIFCGDRKNVTLTHFDGNGYNSYKRGNEILKNLNRDYEHHIRGRAEIEDMINDMIHTDKEFLKWYNFLHEKDSPSTNIQPTINSKIELKL